MTFKLRMGAHIYATFLWLLLTQCQISNEHRTSNVQHRMLNLKHEETDVGIACLFLFDVQRSMLDVRLFKTSSPPRHNNSGRAWDNNFRYMQMFHIAHPEDC